MGNGYCWSLLAVARCHSNGVRLAIRLGVLGGLFPMLANSRHKTLIYRHIRFSGQKNAWQWRFSRRIPISAVALLLLVGLAHAGDLTYCNNIVHVVNPRANEDIKLLFSRASLRRWRYPLAVRSVPDAFQPHQIGRTEIDTSIASALARVARQR